MSNPQNNIALLLDSRATGGIESHVLELALALKATGNTPIILLWCDYGVHPLQARAQESGIALVKLNGKLRTLISFLRKERIAILHTHGYKANIVGRVTKLMMPLKVIATYHNGDVGEGKLRLYTRIDELSAPLSRNIAVSDDIAARLGNRAQVISNFVGMPRHLRASRRTHVAFVGRLEAEKAPLRFSELTRHFTGLRFAVFGQGSLRAEMEATSGSNTHFFGQISEMTPYWSGIDILVMPSLTEGLPMAALEAMSHGVPVIATPVGALPSLIKHNDNGFLVDGSPQSLIDAVEYWRALPERTRMTIRRRARDTILDHYSAQAIISDVLDVYAA
jgi:glycosyltransferase involved in cell wall biosynthesis